MYNKRLSSVIIKAHKSLFQSKTIHFILSGRWSAGTLFKAHKCIGRNMCGFSADFMIKIKIWTDYFTALEEILKDAVCVV